MCGLCEFSEKCKDAVRSSINDFMFLEVEDADAEIHALNNLLHFRFKIVL